MGGLKGDKAKQYFINNDKYSKICVEQQIRSYELRQ